MDVALGIVEPAQLKQFSPRILSSSLQQQLKYKIERFVITCSTISNSVLMVIVANL